MQDRLCCWCCLITTTIITTTTIKCHCCCLVCRIIARCEYLSCGCKTTATAAMIIVIIGVWLYINRVCSLSFITRNHFCCLR